MDVNLKLTKRLINHVAKEGQYLFGQIMLSPLLQLQWVLFLKLQLMFVRLSLQKRLHESKKNGDKKIMMN